MFTVALSSLAVAAPVFENSSYNSSACQELKRRYSNLTSFPGSNEYVSGVAGKLLRSNVGMKIPIDFCRKLVRDLR